MIVTRLLSAALAVIGTSVLAQPAAPARPDPLDAAAPVPKVQHRSSLSNYRRYGDEPLGSWRDANDTVNRIGGWRSYLREAHAPEPAASRPAPASTPGNPERRR